ncbi:MAG: TldD/PmbA family protein [Nannocystaceae bacterium]
MSVHELPEPQAVLDVLRRELARSMQGLRVPGAPRPYHMTYALRRSQSLELSAAHGALLRRRERCGARVYADIRVGNHQFDNVIDGGLGIDAEDLESADWIDAPDDLDLLGLQIALWKLTQIKFDEALEDYLDHRKAMVSEYLRDEVGALTMERLGRHREALHNDPFPRERLESTLRALSRRFLQHPEIYDPSVELFAERVQRWLCTSDGAEVITEDVYVHLVIEGWVLTERDGVYVHGSRELYLRAIDEIPDAAALEALMDEALRELAELRKAPSPGAFIGPALLSGQAAATLFHEALGHRLEGERLVARGESKTFAHKVGERILPVGLSVADDPTIDRFQGHALWGSYRVDDQGVPAKRAVLVEDGVLRGFLQSRSPIPGSAASNGHGRHDGIQRPMARMGTLVIEAAEGGKSWESLVDQLIAVARAQGRSHAVIITRVRAGETTTSDYDFQAFKGELAEVHLIDVETRRLQRIRDVELIGTPLSALQRIVGYGQDAGVDQGYCYAESGSVPVSGIAPPIVLAELELQQKSTTGYHEPLLPPPFADDGSRGRRGKLRERGRRRPKGAAVH